MMKFQVLQERFGYSSFRNGQEAIIDAVLKQQDVLAMLPTGTGKSLCYQLPGYLIKGTVLIISPLISLMQDQVEQLALIGERKAIALNSFLNSRARAKALQNLNQYRFIYISPEMLRMEGMIDRLKNVSISLFVIDEAHCISQWGHDFRPDYLSLGEIRECLGAPPALALTATAQKEVRDDIKHYLKLKNPNEFIYSVDRPNIAIMIERVQTANEKKQRLLELVRQLKKPGIIYFSSKRVAEEMVEHLKLNGVKAVAAYHGGMDQEQRILIQQQFLNDQLNVICATSAFGMGVNKNNIRFVIHFHMPGQVESYLQEIGRAGRDGQESVAILMYSPGDEELPLRLSEYELPEKWQIDAYFNTCQLKNETDLVAELRLSETQLRFLKHYYLLNSQDIEQQINKVKTIRMKRLNYKVNKVWQMYRWIQSTDCRRKQIITIFGENDYSKPADCCDICTFDLSNYYEELTHIENLSSNSWVKRLQQLLKQEVNPL
ncbi:RecQ family ATP-dependent DNA helicase [Bacillus niameyensis]|uniref:RecQ family ATP-dependent DNA helicase n=1 Tax=Bacillus niameyensis TaxID=1522308 RepID=UPI000785F85D|nr:ATP-dependent DNA helicase RecQ [Bacillus niameyensis]